MLEVQNIAFAYGRRRILEDVTLKVDSGETVALVGANGSGKTTLMRVLSGLLLPTSGMVRADGFDVAKEPIRFRRALGYLPEHAPIACGLSLQLLRDYHGLLQETPCPPRARQSNGPKCCT